MAHMKFISDNMSEIKQPVLQWSWTMLEISKTTKTSYLITKSLEATFPLWYK